MIGRTFTIFKSALVCSHQLARSKVSKGDIVIDATCGRGHDTLLLARLVGETGKVYAFDIQDEALLSSKQLLAREGLLERVEFIRDDHSRVDLYISAKPRFCMFNLGYLPGGDHSKTTCASTTLTALGKMTTLLAPGGSITLVAYSGHPGGKEEVDALRSYLAGVSQYDLEIVELSFINQANNPAHLFVATKLNGGTV